MIANILNILGVKYPILNEGGDYTDNPHCSVYTIDRTRFFYPKHKGVYFNLLYIKSEGLEDVTRYVKDNITPEYCDGVRTYTVTLRHVSMRKEENTYAVNICKLAKYGKKQRIISLY
jgi:hypothetical protein